MTDTLPIVSGTSTLQELIDSAESWNAGQVQMVFRNHDDTPLAAVLVVRGEWTKDVLDAIERLEQEGEHDRGSEAVSNTQ